MNIGALLGIVDIVAETLGAAGVPGAKWLELGAEFGQKLTTHLKAAGTVITDENGNPLTNEELAAKVQARWDVALTVLGRISSKADAEIGRTE